MCAWGLAAHALRAQLTPARGLPATRSRGPREHTPSHLRLPRPPSAPAAGEPPWAHTARAQPQPGLRELPRVSETPPRPRHRPRVPGPSWWLCGPGRVCRPPVRARPAPCAPHERQRGQLLQWVASDPTETHSRGSSRPFSPEAGAPRAPRSGSGRPGAPLCRAQLWALARPPRDPLVPHDPWDPGPQKVLGAHTRARLFKNTFYYLTHPTRRARRRGHRRVVSARTMTPMACAAPATQQGSPGPPRPGCSVPAAPPARP